MVDHSTRIPNMVLTQKSWKAPKVLFSEPLQSCRNENTLLPFIFFHSHDCHTKKTWLSAKAEWCFQPDYICFVFNMCLCAICTFFEDAISLIYSAFFCWVWLLILIIVALSHILWVTWKYCISWSQKTIELLINENKYTPFHWNCFWAR